MGTSRYLKKLSSLLFAWAKSSSANPLILSLSEAKLAKGLRLLQRSGWRRSWDSANVPCQAELKHLRRNLWRIS